MTPAAPASSAAPETRQRIVEAALDVFTERGFDGASTRQIASRAGVNHGLIPYYFGSKKKLWQAAVDDAFGDMQVEIDALLGEAGDLAPRDRVARMIRAHVRYVARRPAFVRLMYEEGKRRGERMRWIVDRHVQPLYDAVAQVVADLRPSEGAAPGLSPVHFFYAMAGAAGLVFHQAEECRRVSGEDPFDADFVEQHAQLVERMLLGPDPTAPTS